LGRAFLDSAYRDKQHDAKKREEAMESALASMWVTYCKTEHSTEEGQTGYLTKMYLHGLVAGGGPATTLCVRFALAEHVAEEDGGDALYDVSLTVLQVKPFVSNSAKFTFSFAMQDTPAAAAGDWALDESQRARLLELHALLRLPPSMGTAAAMLGLLLASAGGAGLEKEPFFAEALSAARTAHREELLASGGSLF